MSVDDYQEWLDIVWVPRYVMNPGAEPPLGFSEESHENEYEAEQLRLSVTG